MSVSDLSGRRPLKSRNLVFFQRLAAWLAQRGVAPNSISFCSILCGGIAGAALAGTDAAFTLGWARGCFLIAAAAIQLRLIANLLDGMVAVEGRKGGPTGDLWNEVPDRIADGFIFVGAGYAAGSWPQLGWAAALSAVFVAYVRSLGASVGAGQSFLGPMAKPHRMAAMTVLSIAGAFFPWRCAMSGGVRSQFSTKAFGFHCPTFIPFLACRLRALPPPYGWSYSAV